jgi:hypothetical protein
MKILRIAAPLVISALLIAFVGLMLRSHLRYEGIETDLSSWGSFFNVFGVIFAIVAGFLLVTVLNRYSNLNQTIEDELNAVESVRDFLVYLDDRQQSEIDKIKRALEIYVKSVANTEWAEMSAPAIPMNSDTSEELYEVMRSGKGIKVSEERDNIVLSALIETISEITKLRTRRIALANERLPPRLRVLMLFMSTTLVGAFVFLGVQGIFAHIYMLVTLSVSIHLLYMVIEDLDHPFYGVWNIRRGPLDELVKRFEQDVPNPNT